MQEAKVTLSQNLFLFPYSLKVLLAEVKIFVVSFTFTTQKTKSRTPKPKKTKCNSQSCFQHTHRLAYMELLCIQACSLHSVFCFYLAIIITLMVKPVSNSEQTNKCKEVLGEQTAYHKEVLAASISNHKEVLATSEFQCGNVQTTRVFSFAALKLLFRTH